MEGGAGDIRRLPSGGERVDSRKGRASGLRLMGALVCTVWPVWARGAHEAGLQRQTVRMTATMT
jgi:hypothetical protein